MTKNLYFQEVVRRKNHFKEAIFDFALSMCSIPRLILEVFIRRRFGVRYFSYFTAIIAAILLLLFSIPVWEFYSLVTNWSSSGSQSFWAIFFKYFLSWYGFIVAFLYVARKRRQEVKRSPSVFDFAHYSLSNGYLTRPCWEFMKRWLPNCDIRKRETIVEPLAFFIAGFVILIFAQPIGLVIMIAAVFYSLSYLGAYHKGDNWVMDQIDEIIMNEDKETVFLEDEDPEFGRGVRFFAERPTSKEMREKLTERMEVKEDEPVISG